MKKTLFLLLAACAAAVTLTAGERMLYLHTPERTVPVPIARTDSITFGLWAPGDTIIDFRNLRAYPTVGLRLVGGDSACWMGSNLFIGTPIASECMDMYGGLPATATDNSVIERYHLANGKVFDDIAGALYSWDEAMDYGTAEGARGICPAGWHIPSETDWWRLIEKFDAIGLVSGGWAGTDIDTTLLDSTVDCRFDCPAWCENGSNLAYWTSTEYDSGHAMLVRFMVSTDGSQPTVNISPVYPKAYGACLRCIRD